MIRPMSRSPLPILAAGVFVWLTASSPAVELITNGDFESFSSGNPTGWTYTQGDGPATLEIAVSSPFSNIYPFGSSSLLFTDGASGSSPILLQSFTAQTAPVFAAWEFRLDTMTGNPWCVQIDDSVVAATRFNMDAAGQFQIETTGGGFADILALTANTWYQVYAKLDRGGFAGLGRITGTIQPFGGAATAFETTFRATGSLSINRFVFIDIAPGTGGEILLDNVSVNTIPEPSAAALLLAGAAGAIVLRARRS
jgi:hypothetical protein